MKTHQKTPSIIFQFHYHETIEETQMKIFKKKKEQNQYCTNNLSKFLSTILELHVEEGQYFTIQFLTHLYKEQDTSSNFFLLINFLPSFQHHIIIIDHNR